MPEALKICPICGTRNSAKAATCTMCGTSLAHIEVVIPEAQSAAPGVYTAPEYDFRHGETDLMETKLGRAAGVYYVLLMVIITALSLGLLILAAVPLLSGMNDNNAQPTAQLVETTAPQATMMLITVTPAPPTPTFTTAPTPTIPITPSPTPEPCIQEVRAGEGLIEVISRCGHRDLDVLTPVATLNGISSGGAIQAGQRIVVPWPTPTTDPNAVPTETPELTESASGAVGFVLAGSDFDEESVFQPTATPTLMPGLQWHIVQPGETMLDLIFIYGVTMRILSELNPEITFSQCDFGEIGGGTACTVQLSIGQYVRVPAPPPTATIQPSPSGSETATPSATATYNAPSLVRPGNLAPFGRDELVTLRWVTTATLAPGETYRLNVQDETAGIAYEVLLTGTEYTLPEEWQGQDGQSHTYRWNVSVLNANGEATFTSETRTFTWQSR